MLAYLLPARIAITVAVTPIPVAVVRKSAQAVSPVKSIPPPGARQPSIAPILRVADGETEAFILIHVGTHHGAAVKAGSTAAHTIGKRYFPMHLWPVCNRLNGSAGFCSRRVIERDSRLCDLLSNDCVQSSELWRT